MSKICSFLSVWMAFHGHPGTRRLLPPRVTALRAQFGASTAHLASAKCSGRREAMRSIAAVPARPFACLPVSLSGRSSAQPLHGNAFELVCLLFSRRPPVGRLCRPQGVLNLLGVSPLQIPSRCSRHGRYRRSQMQNPKPYLHLRILGLCRWFRSLDGLLSIWLRFRSNRI